MELVNAQQNLSICGQQFLSEIHAAFYANLPEKHRLTWLHPFRDGNGSSNWGRVLRPRLD
jgi:fido (protein-threonine AMPylation protein)